MPRTCTVCFHKSRRKIDKAIAFGKSNRAIAGQFRLTRSSVQRHKKHAAATIKRATEKRELSIGENILDCLHNLYQRGLDLLASAERTKNHSACIGYLRELRGILGAIHEVTGKALPKRATKLLPDELLAAISRALGVTGQLVPRDRRLPSSNRDRDIDLDVLPE